MTSEELAVITFSSDRPPTIDCGMPTVENSGKEPGTSANGFSLIVLSRSICLVVPQRHGVEEYAN